MIRSFIRSTIVSSIHPDIRHHLFYYTSMFVLLLLGFFLVVDAAPQVNLQLFFVVLISIIYFLWATLHHYIHHDLHPKVVLEYMLVGLLGVSISFFIFQMQR